MAQHQAVPDYGVEEGRVGPEDESWRNDPYKPPEMPFDCFKRPNVMEQLAQHPHTRPYCLDSGFLEGVRRMQNARTQQAAAASAGAGGSEAVDAADVGEATGEAEHAAARRHCSPRAPLALLTSSELLCTAPAKHGRRPWGWLGRVCGSAALQGVHLVGAACFAGCYYSKAGHRRADAPSRG